MLMFYFAKTLLRVVNAIAINRRNFHVIIMRKMVDIESVIRNDKQVPSRSSSNTSDKPDACNFFSSRIRLSIVLIVINPLSADRYRRAKYTRRVFPQ